MKRFELTQEEIRICISGLLFVESEWGLDDKERALLEKLETLAAL